MGIQSNFNNNMTGWALIASAAYVSESIREAGFNDYNQLIAAIKELEIKIAEAKDSGREYTEMDKLLQKYLALKAQADQEEAERREKQKRIVWFFCVIMIVVMCIGLAVVFSYAS